MAEERRVEPGQRVSGALSSRTVNTMIELVRGQRLQRLGPEGGAWPGDALPRGLEVLVRNDTGEWQAPGNVLAIDQGTPVDPADGPGEFELRPLFSGAVPTSSGDVVAVLRDGADDGQVVPAVLRGLAVVALDVTDATHAFAVPIADDSSQMQSATAGYPILWAETGGTGPQYGVVLLDALAAAAPAAVYPFLVATNYANGGNSATVNLPSHTADGDVLLGVAVGAKSGSASGKSLVLPSGWTLLQSGFFDSASEGYYWWFGCRSWSTGDPTTFVWSKDASVTSDGISAVVIAARNAALPTVSSKAAGHSAAPTASSINCPDEDALILNVILSDGGVTWTPPPGMTDVNPLSANGFFTGYQSHYPVGSVGAKAAAFSGSAYWESLLVALVAP